MKEYIISCDNGQYERITCTDYEYDDESDSYVFYVRTEFRSEFSVEEIFRINRNATNYIKLAKKENT